MSSSDSPAHNRVDPFGAVVAAPGLGAFMGNRGRLHDGAGSREVRRHHVGRAWITCLLDFRGRRVRQWDPGHYTPLFFLDEALALAAGHRPCAECRRADYTRFRDLVAAEHGTSHLPAAGLDRLLHDERWDTRRRTRRLHAYAWDEVPDGAYVLLGPGPAVVTSGGLLRWQPDNAYAGSLVERPATGTATVITPPSSVAALRAGYAVQVTPPGGAPQASPSSSSEKA
ncbi:hypothetical protein GCM10009868_07420 [Terrabacter aerolatus]|uniref:Uncharacterized protein n=1 Tax=Terrabacter aerolatus TaxID=422442 RepID=A0A512D6I6_9MICO|nr:hypothetical protein [Terrabacter aerolatus]GEO32072.1 hypothetical protein TAE01_38820 [Terrabacter aerolatus]